MACARGGASAESDTGIDADASVDMPALLDMPTRDLTLADVSFPSDATLDAADMGVSCAVNTQDNDGDGECLPACGAPGVCSGLLGCDDTSGNAVCSACPVTEGATLAWSLVPLARVNWDTAAHVTYATDNRASLATFAWTRIAYCLVLDSNVAYVEMDDFTDHDLGRIGMPMDWVYQQPVSAMTVRSNVSTVTAASEVATGSIEFWSNCYSPGPDGIYNNADVVSTSVDCYGSFQLHNGAATVIAWNGWSLTTANTSIGIGNEVGASSGTDWTDAYNTGLYPTPMLSAYLVP